MPKLLLTEEQLEILILDLGPGSTALLDKSSSLSSCFVPCPTLSSNYASIPSDRFYFVLEVLSV